MEIITIDNHRIYVLNKYNETIALCILVRDSSEFPNTFIISDVYIDKEHRGKGLYKKMLIKAFTDLNCYRLISNCRVEMSNLIYSRWVGHPIDEDDTVYITYNDGKLLFNTFFIK